MSAEPIRKNNNMDSLGGSEALGVRDKVKLPTNKLKKKKTPEFINKVDGLGRSTSIDVIKVELTAKQVELLQNDAKLIGLDPVYIYDTVNKVNVFKGGIGVVAKGTIIPKDETKKEIKENDKV